MPDKYHEIYTCLDDSLTCLPPQEAYIILNSISICQKMSLSTGQVAYKIYLSRWKSYLSQTTGQPLMSHPVSMLFIYCIFSIIMTQFSLYANHQLAPPENCYSSPPSVFLICWGDAYTGCGIVP